MRIRSIKPEFFKDEELAELPPLVRLLFIALWGMADCEGRLSDRPKRIKVEALPYDDVDCDVALSLLHKAHFIVRYRVRGERYIQVTNFLKHQRITGKEAESQSLIPGMSSEASEVFEGNTGGAPETTGREGKGKEGNGVVLSASRNEAFDRFWSEYPRKNAKQDAIKAFMKNGCYDLLETILAAVRSHKKSDEWLRNSGQYVPYAATWLNGKRWEDELMAHCHYVT
jgi:hypothetical protein